MKDDFDDERHVINPGMPLKKKTKRKIYKAIQKIKESVDFHNHLRASETKGKEDREQMGQIARW